MYMHLFIIFAAKRNRDTLGMFSVVVQALSLVGRGGGQETISEERKCLFLAYANTIFFNSSFLMQLFKNVPQYVEIGVKSLQQNAMYSGANAEYYDRLL